MYSWGRLGGSLEAPGLSEGLLGGSWEPLGAILEPLGRVWGSLGAVLGPLGVVSWGHVGIRRFWLIFAAVLDRFGGPNRPPEELKMELKINQNRT